MKAPMTWRNGPNGYGLISRALHWGMALLILVLLSLGLRLSAMQPDLSTLWLYGLHKTLGLSVLALVLLRLVWHRITPPPQPLAAGWQVRAAKAGHLALYLLMLVIPLSGWAASSATGIDTLFADRWVVPPIAPVSETVEATAFAIHAVATKLLMALVTVHALAAFQHEMAGEGTLTRMLRGRR
ncbi:MAG: cytochrome B [Rhodobacteraceae bacterium PARR1]|nr:MAG: cytochrome B [Rhodobacteraceae bacterium PARR1]